MKDGFIKVAAVTPGVRVADPVYNAEKVREGIDPAMVEGAKLIVFPELVISGYTCGDLLLQHTLTDACKRGLKRDRGLYLRSRCPCICGSAVLFQG